MIHNDVSFRELTDGYHQGTKTKDELREEFKKRLKGSPAELRAKMGLTSATADPTDTEVEQFLSTTKCFDNQLLAHIQNDIKGKEKAHENMVDNCLEVARDEYGSFDENELKKSLKKEANGRLRTFLEVPKYRKTYIKKLPG
ncbi:hypothetical protein H6768_03385 [Candidatus Peribacteria bacterium]|nr:hypothetical protein [Candidatus Peribacteria bacterium]